MKDYMKKEKKNKGRVKCSVWSRVVGYLRPTARWNDGVLASFNDRKTFKTNNMGNKVEN